MFKCVLRQFAKLRVIYHAWRIRSLKSTIEASNSQDLMDFFTGQKMGHEYKIREILRTFGVPFPANKGKSGDNL